jgi:hypothetical protein
MVSIEYRDRDAANLQLLFLVIKSIPLAPDLQSFVTKRL